MRGWRTHAVVMSALGVASCGRVGFSPQDTTTEAADADANGSNNSSTGDSGSGSTQTETLTIPAAADTALNSFAAPMNYGAAAAFNVRSDAVSTFTGLLRFDLSVVTGSVTSATLRLRSSNQALSTGSIEIARVLEAWEEGTQNGGTGTANYAFRRGATAWTASGCGPGSRDGAPVTELQPYATNMTYDVTVPANLVQEWVTDPSSNHGIALVAVGTGNDTVTFHSRESAMGPELVVQVMR